jgi:hypothetical protein
MLANILKASQPTDLELFRSIDSKDSDSESFRNKSNITSKQIPIKRKMENIVLLHLAK